MKARPSTSPTSPASSLEKETLAAFSAWRLSAPIGFRRMSESFWGAAVRLAVATSVYKAARLLRLDFSQLKKRVIASSAKVVSFGGFLDVRVLPLTSDFFIFTPHHSGMNSYLEVSPAGVPSKRAPNVLTH